MIKSPLRPPCLANSIAAKLLIVDSHRHRERDPVGAFAGEITAVNQVQVDVFTWIVTDSGLIAWVCLAWTHDREYFGNPAPLLHEIPRNPGSHCGKELFIIDVVLGAKIDVESQRPDKIERDRNIGNQ